MSMKIWRDRESNPYAVLVQGKLFKLGKGDRKAPVQQLMRRLDFSVAGVGVARKGELSPQGNDDPGSRCWVLSQTRSLLSGFAV